MAAPGRLVEGAVTFNSTDGGAVYFDVTFSYTKDSEPGVKYTKTYTKVEPDEINGLLETLQSDENIALP